MSIEQWNEPTRAVESVTPGPTSQLVEWAREADAAYQLAQRLTTTTFCPESFRGKPADAAAAMLAGGELGLSPLAALGAFDVIQGRAAARAITLRALVQSKGHEMVLVESTNTRCRMKGKRAGSNEWQTVSWTIDRAKDLGLTGKKNWKEQPQAMLQARATSELARLIAADAILGIGGGITSEELSDGPVATSATEADPEPSTASGSRRMSRPKKAADPEPNPDAGLVAAQLQREAEASTRLDGETQVVGYPAPHEPNRRGYMFALFGERDDLTERDVRLAYCATVLNRTIETSNDLSDDDTEKVIESLEADDLAAKDLAAWGGQS